MKKQPQFFDFENCVDMVGKKQPFLRRLNTIIDWEIFRPIIKKIHIHEEGGPGRPPFDPVLMFKILILQKLYGLSDDSMEVELYDSISIMEFLDLDLSCRRPDAKTIWHFKEELRRRGIENDLFSRFDMFLRKQGYETKKGVICDASFVEVPVQRITQKESIQLSAGVSPEAWTQKETDSEKTIQRKKHRAAQRDTDAKWTTKNNRSFFGFKNHVLVDSETKLIHAFEVTPASVHDSKMTDKLLEKVKRGQIFYADSAYKSRKTDLKLKAKGIQNRICLKGSRAGKLSGEQKMWNRQKVSRVRSRVEHVFGDMKWYCGDFIRTIGIERAKLQISLCNLLYNFRRLATLTAT